MPALRRAAACLLAALLLLTGARAEARSPRLAMVQEMNAVRTSHGLRPLRYSPSLARSSTKFSRRLLRQDRFAHGATIVASARFSKVGEILALLRGRRPRLRGALAAWVASPAHSAVLLSPSYRYVGTGWARGLMGRQRAVVWTAQFGV